MPFSLTNLTWVNNCDAQPGKMSSNITLLNNMLDYMDTSVNKTVYLYQELEPSYGDWATAYYQKYQTTTIPTTADLYWINSSGFGGWYRFIQGELVIMDSPYAQGKQQTLSFSYTNHPAVPNPSELNVVSAIAFKTYRPTRMLVQLFGHHYADIASALSVKILLYDGVSIYYNFITGVNVGNTAFSNTANNPNTLIAGPTATSIANTLAYPVCITQQTNWSVPAKLTWQLIVYVTYNNGALPTNYRDIKAILASGNVSSSTKNEPINSLEIYYE